MGLGHSADPTAFFRCFEEGKLGSKDLHALKKEFGGRLSAARAKQFVALFVAAVPGGDGEAVVRSRDAVLTWIDAESPVAFGDLLGRLLLGPLLLDELDLTRSAAAALQLQVRDGAAAQLALKRARRRTPEVAAGLGNGHLALGKDVWGKILCQLRGYDMVCVARTCRYLGAVAFPVLERMRGPSLHMVSRSVAPDEAAVLDGLWKMRMLMGGCFVACASRSECHVVELGSGNAPVKVSLHGHFLLSAFTAGDERWFVLVLDGAQYQERETIVGFGRLVRGGSSGWELQEHLLAEPRVLAVLKTPGQSFGPMTVFRVVSTVPHKVALWFLDRRTFQLTECETLVHSIGQLFCMGSELVTVEFPRRLLVFRPDPDAGRPVRVESRDLIILLNAINVEAEVNLNFCGRFVASDDGERIYGLLDPGDLGFATHYATISVASGRVLVRDCSTGFLPTREGGGPLSWVNGFLVRLLVSGEDLNLTRVSILRTDCGVWSQAIAAESIFVPNRPVMGSESWVVTYDSRNARLVGIAINGEVASIMVAGSNPACSTVELRTRRLADHVLQWVPNN